MQLILCTISLTLWYLKIPSLIDHNSGEFYKIIQKITLSQQFFITQWNNIQREANVIHKKLEEY